MLVSYAWLAEYVGEALPRPEDLVDLLTFHSFEIEGVEQVGDDTVIDVDVLPNRGSDCLSHRGIAREIASVLGVPLAHDPLRTPPELPTIDTITVAIEDEQACRRFAGLLVEGVTVGPSPAWLQERLRALGQRPINNVVDATNYVMYALGQPLHAYDADRFPAPDGTWSFGVRPARAGETIDLLGEGGAAATRQVALDGAELLITDASSDTPIGLAGVKGGTYAGVHEETTRIIIEAAHFDPIRVRKAARKLGIVIDASKRFEQEPSPELPQYALAEIGELLRTIASATVRGWYDAYPRPYTVPTVAVPLTRFTRLLGITLPTKEIVSLLTRAGITVTEEGDTLQCTGPFERTDLVIPADFVEEVGRLYGYENIAARAPTPVALPEYNALHVYSERIRAALVAQGFSEIITSSFRKKDQIKLRNALASDKAHLRSSLRPNVTEALDRNAPHTDLLGTVDTRVFEIGTVFTKDAAGVHEHIEIGLGVRVRSAGYSGKEDAIVSEATQAVDAAVGTTSAWSVEKGVATANLSTILAASPIPEAYDPPPPAASVQYRPFSVYPAIARDIALWVAEDTAPDVVAATMLQAVVSSGTPTWEQVDGRVGVLVHTAGSAADIYLQRLDLFDTFSKDGRTSYAFRLVFQSYERTLTDEEMHPVMEAIHQAVATAGYTVR